MGRTLHYRLNRQPNKKEQAILAEICDYYNTRFHWTCENVDLEWGFTKTGGNELNAQTVIQFIRAVSTNLPNVIITLSDEGEALYCPVLVRNGLMKPDTQAMLESLAYWKDKDYLHDGGIWDVTNAEQYYKALLNKNPDWGEPNQYIRPLDDELVQSREWHTQALPVEAASGLPDIINDFLVNEDKESRQYYADIKQFPSIS